MSPVENNTGGLQFNEPIGARHDSPIGRGTLFTDVSPSDEHRSHAALLATRTGVWETVLASGRMYIDPVIKSLLGYTDQEIPNNLADWNRLTLFPPDATIPERALNDHLEGRSDRFEASFRRVHKDGSTRWFFTRGHVERDEQGVAVRVIGVATDISELKHVQEEYERQLEASRRQANLQVREVHHRIRNNLQGVTGLLSLRMEEHPEVAGILAEAKHQIETVALVHDLQSSGHHSNVCLQSMTKSIVDLAARWANVSVQYSVSNTESRELLLEQSKSVAIALILNELLTNAIKHREMSAPVGIAVRLEATDTQARWAVRNPGKLPNHLDYSSGKGLGTGLNLVRSMLPSSGAALHITSADDTVIAELKLTKPTLVLT